MVDYVTAHQPSATADNRDDNEENEAGVTQVDEPMDLLLMSLNENVFVKLRHGREMRGKLVAYDEHLNLMVSDAKEKITETKVDELTKQEYPSVSTIT